MSQDKLEATERRRDELEERLKHLTMVNAGLRAHNQLLEASELGHLCTDSQQVQLVYDLLLSAQLQLRLTVFLRSPRKGALVGCRSFS